MGECYLIALNDQDSVLVVSPDGSGALLAANGHPMDDVLARVRAFEDVINLKLDFEPLVMFLKRLGLTEKELTVKDAVQVMMGVLKQYRHLAEGVQ